jgi:hypothetical protein
MPAEPPVLVRGCSQRASTHPLCTTLCSPCFSVFYYSRARQFPQHQPARERRDRRNT